VRFHSGSSATNLCQVSAKKSDWFFNSPQFRYFCGF
jgi:hypothetical protein